MVRALITISVDVHVISSDLQTAQLLWAVSMCSCCFCCYKKTTKIVATYAIILFFGSTSMRLKLLIFTTNCRLCLNIQTQPFLHFYVSLFLTEQGIFLCVKEDSFKFFINIL